MLARRRIKNRDTNAVARVLDAKYKMECPFCGQVGEGETLQHLLLYCSRWQEERERYMREVLNLVVGLPSDGQLILILGGEFEGQRLVNWLSFKEGASKVTLAGSPLTVEGLCGAFQVAQFLQKIAGPRQSSLGLLIDAHRRIVGNSSQPSQGPNGYGESFFGQG
jgi:hypothetical protein